MGKSREVGAVMAGREELNVTYSLSQKRQPSYEHERGTKSYIDDVCETVVVFSKCSAHAHSYCLSLPARDVPMISVCYEISRLCIAMCLYKKLP
jgi:hypothetical protein